MRMRSRAVVICAAVSIMGLCCIGASAQYAELSGRVTDPKGLPVPKVKIEAVNVLTNISRSTETNETGLYYFPSLPPAPAIYRILVEKEGFDLIVKPNVELHVEEHAVLNFELRIGSMATQVTVEGGAPLVQATSSVVQTTIESRDMRDLELNGRDSLQLLTLIPGTAGSGQYVSGGINEHSDIEVNGQRPQDNSYELDGVDYSNRYMGFAPILPNPDALQEFTARTSNFTAKESGAGADVQYTTRSGTNEFHGSAFEFLRNDALDSRNFFSSETTPFKRNQFGFTFGGPILRDKTFFFGSYQGTRLVGGASPAVAQVPSAAERGGDFSALSKPIVDPTTGLQFTATPAQNPACTTAAPTYNTVTGACTNIVPTARFDPLAVKLLPFIPLPNQPNGTLASPPSSNENDDQFLIRVDHNLTQKDRLSFHYFYDSFKVQRQTSTLPGNYGLITYHNRSLMASETHTFSPTLILNASFGIARSPRREDPVQPTTLQALGAQVAPTVSNSPPELHVNINGYVSAFGGASFVDSSRDYEWRGALTWMHGKHLVTFGMDVLRNLQFSGSIAHFVLVDSMGNWTFNGSRTASSNIPGSGDSFADFMLGLPAMFSQGTSDPQDIAETDWQPWVQDDWRISRRLTLNLGLRWDPWLPAIDRQGPQPGFLPGVHSTVAPNAPAGLFFSGDPGFRDSIFADHWKNLAPRVGFAWDVTGNGKSIVRGAYGIFYRPAPLNIQRATSASAAFRGLSVNVLAPASFSNPYFNFPGGDPFPWTPPTLASLKTFVFPTPVVTSALSPDTPASYTQEWNLTAERQLGHDTAVSLSYVGNHMVHGIDERQGNPAIYRPGATVANTDSRRIYPGIGSLFLVEPFEFSNYNSLQLNVTKRAARGVNLVGNYVYSKCMDNGSGANANSPVGINKFDPAADYGPCDFDFTHRSNVALVYDLPEVSAWHGFAAKLVNGWTTSSILTFSSGGVFTVSSGRDNSLSGNPNNDKADQIGLDSARPSGANQLLEWFNTAAFTQNAVGTFGTAGRNSLRGPGSWNVNFGLLKTTTIMERVRTEFRFEAFNLFNHTRFNNPVSSVSDKNFGRIQGAGDPRVIQFALKLIF